MATLQSPSKVRALAASTVPSPTPASIWISLNGAPSQQITVPDQNIPLLYVLRNQPTTSGGIAGVPPFALKGPRLGCGLGECGSCEVFLPAFGQAARTCQATIGKLLAYFQAYGYPPPSQSYPLALLTLEGLVGADGTPHPLQQAFIDQQAGQCAYCMNGMIMGAYAFLKGRYQAGNMNVPTTAEVTDFYSNGTFTDPTVSPPKVSPTPYLCRCGAHLRIIAAIQEATPAVLARFAKGQI